MRVTPFKTIQQLLVDQLPSGFFCLLPDKWEKIGDVVIIKLPDILKHYQELIGKTYAEVLGCKTALNDTGGITGVYRTPQVEVLSGSPHTETIHTENGVRYKLDPQKIMFSSGNMAERKRMGTIAQPTETVVDLFAGIGYFSLPMAKYSQPKKIVACEMNETAYQYLCDNIVLNHVTTIIEPILGDNRATAPKDCAQRVVMGYFEQPYRFLPVAFECLKHHQGILHYHDAVPIEAIPDKPLKDVTKAAKKYNRSATMLSCRTIKSYAPDIDHVVLDIKIGEL